MYLIVYIQRSKQCRRCQRYATDFNALFAMYVEDVKDVEDGVCSFYAKLHTELLILLLMSKAQNTYKHVFAHNFLNI